MNVMNTKHKEGVLLVKKDAYAIQIGHSWLIAHFGRSNYLSDSCYTEQEAWMNAATYAVYVGSLVYITSAGQIATSAEDAVKLVIPKIKMLCETSDWMTHVYVVAGKYARHSHTAWSMAACQLVDEGKLVYALPLK